MPVSTAIAQFLREFEILETHYVGTAFEALTTDVSLIKQAQTRLQLEGRLTLMKRIAMARVTEPPALEQLERIIEGTTRLQDKRDELSRNLSAVAAGSLSDGKLKSHASVPLSRRFWIPTESEIGVCNSETIRLQRSLEALAETFRRGSATSMSPLHG